jgi:hypothetical protein
MRADSSRQKLIPPTPLTDEQVEKTFFDIKEAIRYRLRLTEIIPVEMSDYHIGGAKIIILLNSTHILMISNWSSAFHSEGFIPNVALSMGKYQCR